MGLLVELDARRHAAGRDYVERIEAAGRRLHVLGVPQAGKRFGDLAPDFALTSAQGSTVGLSVLLGSGPVVLSFYRGEWCPFCQAEVDALLAAQPAMARLGATLVLIAPKTPSARLLARAEALGPNVHLLCDPMLGAALNYGLVYRVPDTLRRFYLAKNAVLAQDLGARSWLLPLPADFVVGTNGRIELAFIEPDFTRRLDPALIVERLQDLVAGA